jgi:type I restriction enzyme R subunit
VLSQFAFLATDFPDILAHAERAEEAARADPRASCFYARLALEALVDWLYRHDGSLRVPYERTLAARIYEPTFQRLVGPPIVTKARIVKDIGNAAVHEPRAVAPGISVTALRELFHIAYWLTRTYGRTTKIDSGLAFDPGLLPQTRQVSVASLAQLQEASKLFIAAIEARDAAIAERAASEDERAKLQAEVSRIRAEIDAIKAANAAMPDSHDYNEAQTRDTFIDLLLHEAGWALDRAQDREFPVTGMPNAGGAGFVDYVLWGDDGKPIGLVEAKRTRRDARVGQQQAKLYADRLEETYGQRPIIFYSNGYQHWMWDDRRYPPRSVQGFLKKDELELAVQRRQTLRSLAPEDIDGAIAERFYQQRAIRRLCESFERDSLRKGLLVMATGSGKTRTVIALADLLMRANWVKRVLFLADRVALVNQAVNAFKRHLPTTATVNLVTEKDGHGRVYVSTYPTIMGLIDDVANGKRRFGAGQFDLVVIDEAHRSVYRKYGSIFEYFDSLLIGLTATPKDEVDRDTYRLFELERGVPTDVYGLDDAVQDGFLVPPRAVSVPLKFSREGIKYADLSDEEKAEWDEIEWSEDGVQTPTEVDAAALNTWLFNTDTVDKVLEHLMTYGQSVAGGDRLGKTIIFAKNHHHAQFIVSRFDANYPHLKGSFARVIDFKTEYAQSLIDDFANPDRAPHVAVSVDMLDTGIDIPEVLNLVLFKVVRSKTKFWQMLGRGTRLCPNLFGPGQHKEFFLVFDFCMNFEFFNQSPKTTAGVIAESLTKRIFVARAELVGIIQDTDDRDKSLEALGMQTAALLREQVAAMSLDNFLVRPQRRLVEKYARAEAWEDIRGETLSELVDSVAGLPSAYTDEDLDAKQFDLLLLRAQLALLRADGGLELLRRKVVTLARLLEGLANIPMVQVQLELVMEIQTDGFWKGVTAAILDDARRRLRSLIKLIDVRRRPTIYTDFEDQIGPAVSFLLPGMSVGTDMERVRLKARQFLQSHGTHVSIEKLRRNEPLTATDLSELERMFVEAGVGAPEEVQRIAADGGGLGVFVRTLVGLDRMAAKAAFAAFLVGRNLTADQLEFINMLVEHITARGIVDPRQLYESPFTDIDVLGVSGVFGEREVAEIVDILAEIRRRAVA